MKIYLATDHAGFELKEKVKAWLKENNYEVEDFGAFEYNKDDDYPDFVLKAAEAVSKNPSSKAIILGGSGQGEAMVANRYKGVRAAVFYGPVQPRTAIDAKGTQSNDPFEIIKLPRTHEDANVLSLGARFLTGEEATKAVQLWLETPFSDEERHKRRIGKF
jgi:ribose 5-phosphate isomerase B